MPKPAATPRKPAHTAKPHRKEVEAHAEPPQPVLDAEDDEQSHVEPDRPAQDGVPRIYCTARRNFAPVVIDEKTNQTKMEDAGGYRISVYLDKEHKGVFYNKKLSPTDTMSAVWFARLKAVECMKQWMPDAKHFYVCDEHAELKSTNRTSPSVRYRYIAEQHAQGGGFRFELLRVKVKENLAKEANIPNAPHFYTDLAKDQLAKQQQQHLGGERSAVSPADVARLLLNKDFAAAVLAQISTEQTHDNAPNLYASLESYVANQRQEEQPTAEQSHTRGARI
jgi:hypothetical protein